LAHRTAGLRTERRRYRARPDERRRAAGGAARHAGFVDWMHDASEGRKLGRRTHREFVAIRFSRDERTGGFEFGDRRGFIWRPIPFENPRPTRGREFDLADVVLGHELRP